MPYHGLPIAQCTITPSLPLDSTQCMQALEERLRLVRAQRNKLLSAFENLQGSGTAHKPYLIMLRDVWMPMRSLPCLQFALTCAMILH